MQLYIALQSARLHQLRGQTQQRRLSFQPPSGLRFRLEVERYLTGQRAWRDVMRAAKGGEEVVERVFVRQINDGQLGAPFVFVAVKDVVMAQSQIEQAPVLNALWIVIIILFARCRNVDQG